MLARFGEPSRSRMRAKIRADRAALRDQAADSTADATARHTYHEFVVGLHLLRSGLSPEYNHRLDGKTPDWYDAGRRLVMEVFTCERGGSTAPGPRVVSRIAQKVRKYSQTVQAQSLRFVVAVYGDALSGLTAEVCERAIHNGGLFATHPDLSGVLYFAEDAAKPADRERRGAIQERSYTFTFFEKSGCNHYMS